MNSAKSTVTITRRISNPASAAFSFRTARSVVTAFLAGR
jgi:hypothetical protein